MAYLGETTTFDKLKPGDVFRFGNGENERATYIMALDGYFWNPLTGNFNDPLSESPSRKVTLVVPEPTTYFPKPGTVIRSRAGRHYTRISEHEWISEHGTRLMDADMFYQDRPEKYFTVVAGG